MATPTNVISYEQPGANIYGVVPCPECKSPYRYPYKTELRCDGCGFNEPRAAKAAVLEEGAEE